jgi:tetratricopeptide (TPR) repeat protein
MSTQPPDAPTWRQISEYLDHGLELAPEARERWLTDLAIPEPLLVRRLRELFAEHEGLTSRGFLESPALQVMDLSALPPPSMAGKRAGGYTIERLLGRGGMGEVWLAVRSDGRFEGHCALKFLDSSAAQPKLADRFRHEGRLLARLTHPNIARLIDAGSVDDGRQYLALEYVDGEPIDRYCESHTLSVEARVRLFLDVVSAVAHAHTNLVIHRDIKPSNVLVTKDGVAKLLDFGIAKLLRPESAGDDPALTRVEEVALTPEYAAPEQLIGDLPSTATDVYQLGLLLYVLLTGRHPLPASGSRAERVKAALTGLVPLASDFARGPVRKSLRGDLDAILTMALRKDSKERYPTAAALRDDLVRHLNREPVSARRGATLYQARRFVQRHWLAVLGSTVAVAGLCAAVVMISAERDRAFAMARRNAAVTDFMDTMITEAAGADVPVTVNDMVARGEQLLLADKSGDRETQAAVLLTIASYRDSVGDHDKAIQLLDRGLALLRDSPDDDLRARLICGRAVVSVQTGPPEAALREITREIDSAPARSTGRAECLFDRGLFSLYLDDADGALKYSTAALAELRASPLASKLHEANYLAPMAEAYRAKGRNREAFDTYAQVLQMYAELGLSRGEQATSTRNNLAVALEAAGMPNRALPIFEENVKIMTARAGPVHPSFLFNRAHALEVMGRYAEALAAYRAGLQTIAQSSDRHEQALYLLGLASTARLMDDTEAAAGYLTQAAERLGPSEPADTLPSIKLAFSRGMIALAHGNLAEARAEFARASLRQRGKPTTIDILLGKAEAALLAGEAAASAESARAALTVATELQGGEQWSYRAGFAWLMLGRALQRLGDGAQAHEAFASAVNHLANTVDANHPALVRARTLAAAP